MSHKDKVYGVLRIFDGVTMNDRLIAEIISAIGESYVALTGRMLLQFEALESANLDGFIGWLQAEQ